MADADAAGGYPALWDWRRRVSDLYGAVRAEPDPRRAWTLWREARDRLFRDHPQSPLEPGARERFAGLPFFDYDPALRFAVDLDPLAAAPVAADAGHDGALSLRPFARTRGLAGALGAELTLYWVAGYGGGAFLPFADATAGHGTYGGGRYLVDTIKSADLGTDAAGRTVLDFNFSYNPSCSYSPAWTCPLSPPANRLAVPVRAGERAPEFG
ncbi:DUF1684 domain-containing protein [Lichenibacterium dinghuense]|uniref:DUF1684 domain-containing protein n=1 Tax=Lichenibacterium dinghuense TaxID=2895977 RepID=UPI001F28BD57|nr:DUF1684 domain-containing protein [Lichenibacterium sp. 6Y81]